MSVKRDPSRGSSALWWRLLPRIQSKVNIPNRIKIWMFSFFIQSKLAYIQIINVPNLFCLSQQILIFFQVLFSWAKPWTIARICFVAASTESRTASFRRSSLCSSSCTRCNTPPVSRKRHFVGRSIIILYYCNLLGHWKQYNFKTKKKICNVYFSFITVWSRIPKACPVPKIKLSFSFSMYY